MFTVTVTGQSVSMTAAQKFAMVITTSGTVSEPSTSVVTPMLMAANTAASFAAKSDPNIINAKVTEFNDKSKAQRTSRHVLSRIMFNGGDSILVDLEPFDISSENEVFFSVYFVQVILILLTLFIIIDVGDFRSYFRDFII